LAPWADIFYACDSEWWEKHHADVNCYPALKIAIQEDGRKLKWPDVKPISVVRNDDSLRFERFGEVGWGGNSGFHAINLAVQFGAKRIVLVGYDMRLDGGIHWHGRHGNGLHNPSNSNVARWRRVIDEAAPLLTRLGVEVVNTSPVSALTAYPKMTLEAALAA